MIPTALSRQLEQGLADFLKCSFWSSTPGMEGLVDRLLGEDRESLLKGPFISVKMPFESGENPSYFPDVPLDFVPHLHQELAFRRLGGRRKESTLVATGTGSGKTESFLLPILDHCLSQAHQPGVKAVIVYPMNALATDQAGRIAGLIAGNEKLRGRVRAGLYIGRHAWGKGPRGETRMGPTTVITDRGTLQEAPPDILLTNYKMLDYLLLRPEDQRIWQHNGKGVLRFLVVDEIHTFDGAQGSDLACLIRRLKRRLDSDDGSLCCVGTSATLGGSEAVETLRQYAHQVFGEPFDERSVIGEARQDEETFLHGADIRYTAEPEAHDKGVLDPTTLSDPEAWIAAQERLWLGDGSDPVHVVEAAEYEDPEDEHPEDEHPEDRRRVELGRRLRHHGAFQALLRALAGRPVDLSRLVAELSRSRRAWREDPELGELAVISLVSLVSRARAWRHELPEPAERRKSAGLGRPTQPFLETRAQLWQRELRRMVATVGREPRLRHSMDLDKEDLRRRHLPVVHCRECGALGWATIEQRDRRHLLQTDLRTFYNAFFGNDPRVRFLYPKDAWPEGDPMRETAFTLDCRHLTKVRPEDRPEGETVKVVAAAVTRSTAKGRRLSRDCVFCEARESLTVVGFRAATLTSLYIDQLFASRFNDDKKLLAFSDSVQDAAHRAGFFGARTWRTNLRIAMLRQIREHGEPGSAGLSLADLSRGLGPWTRGPMGLPAWLSTFLAPNMAWLHDWDTLRERGELPRGSELPAQIDRRLAYEVMLEFGMQARIGRSLCRTGAASVALDRDTLERAVAECLEPLRNEVAGLRDVDSDTVRSFLLGCLHHLRCRGGILGPELPTRYLETGGKDSYGFKNDKALPDYGPTSRLPALLTDRPAERFESWAGTGETWYRRWADRCFGEGAALVADAGSIYPLVLPIWVRAGLLEERVGKRGEPVWGLAQAALRLTPGARSVVCDRPGCGHRRQVSVDEADLWLGMPCATARCEGSFRIGAQEEPDYFGRLYAGGDLQRIFTEEHTGLLERQQREKIETQFKAQDGPEDDPAARRPWYPNLLSCTPTLEMGIDIGDLSAAFLCSVPPGQANYLQRIGRAGRRDGNAFLLTMAAARSHDGYFFADPRQMLAGEVPPPGVFLDTPALLERQLTAFCMDCWGAEQGLDAELPAKLSQVFSRLDRGDPRHFPFNFRAFVSSRREILVREFADMFGSWIRIETREHLARFLDGEHGGTTLDSRLVDTFYRERKQRDALAAKVKTLRTEIRKLQGAKARDRDHEQLLQEHEAQKAALTELVKKIDGQRTLEFLTDQGMLPNYTFPESAVRLRSVIWRKKKEVPAQGNPYEVWSYEYTRSPSSALSELAPGAYFYASGRRVAIDEVVLSSSDVETWRFCPECHFARNTDLGDEAGACPACGASGWRDSGQKMKLLKLEQVMARSPDRESRIRDDSDDRQVRFFDRHMHVTLDDGHPSKAWRIDDPKFPFAFEYRARATFRDLNFGEASDQGTKNTIAGREAVRQGFELCVRCGKVQQAGKAREHTLTCPSRRGEGDERIEPCLYLYREFSSEALRLLLPVAELGARELHSFVAALHLGLQCYFGGSVDHLRTTVYSEPVTGSNLRKQYLVLYDAVPGGTSTLGQLVQTDPNHDHHHGKTGEMALFVALGKALERIDGCSCRRSAEADGCYRCLYAFRNHRDLDDISSRVASRLLRRILKGRDQLEAIERLGDVSVSGLFDSALEAHFIEALDRVRDADGHTASLRRFPIGSKVGWLWTLGNAQWRIEPQVHPPESETGGVSVSIDFVLRPMDASSDRRLAIFLDGWEFHRDRIAKDLFQRTALAASGRWQVWTLTWADVQARFTKGSERADLPVDPAVPDRAALKRYFEKTGLTEHVELAGRTTFDWLVGELLREGGGRPWNRIAPVLTAARSKPAGPTAARAWRAFGDRSPAPGLRAPLAAIEPRFLGAGSSDDHPFVELMAAHGGCPDDRPTWLCVLDDRPENRSHPDFKTAWQQTWRLFQWLSQGVDAWILARSADQETFDYGALVALRSPEADPSSDTRWDCFGEIESEYSELAERLAAEGLPEPEVGLDIPAIGGRVWGDAELVWLEAKVAVTSHLDCREATGRPDTAWTLFFLEDLPESQDGGPDISAVVAALASRTED